MTDQYIKIDGTWTKVIKPYIRRGDVWTPVKESWVKQAGAWVKAWSYDTVPCSPPVLTLQLQGGNRYIRVGVRLPETSHQTDLRRIRVLVSDTAYPTAWNGSGAITGSTDGGPNEAWSDWWYNNSDPVAPVSNHPDSSVESAKNYPRNPTSTTNLPGNKYYYFTAWSEDVNNNWSVGVQHRIWMPKDGVAQSNVRAKEAYIQPSTFGSNMPAGTYTEGQAKATGGVPGSDAVFFYGSRFNENIGKEGTPTIANASIRLSRAATDPGQPQANVKLGWHDMSSSAAMTGRLVLSEVTNLGTLGKGETKWFPLPDTWFNNFSTQIKGVGIQTSGLASDDIVLNDVITDFRQGEVNVNWTEAL